jgi:hypothetical protein
MAHAFLNSGKTPAPAIFCQKIAYPTRKAARKVLGLTEKKRNAPTAHRKTGTLEIYKCFCGSFHVGHAPYKRKV